MSTISEIDIGKFQPRSATRSKPDGNSRLKPGNDSSQPKPALWLTILLQFALSVPLLLTIPAFAAGITAVLASPLAAIPAGSTLLRWIIWGCAAPLIYTIWLLLTLIICALDVQSRSWYLGLKKVERDVRRVVATALGLPVHSVSPTFTANECAAWDSLGQMAIASALHSLLGVAIPTARSFRLRSVPEIVDYLTNHSASPAGVGQIALPSNPELLPLLDHSQATRLLAQRASQTPPQPPLPETTVVVAATFTADPLNSTLTLWSNAFGIPVKLESAGFNQIPQALLSPDSSFRRNANGVNVVLARPEDLLSGDRGEQILSAIAQFSSEFPNLLLVANLPPVVSCDCPAGHDEIRRLRTSWEQSLSDIAGIQRLDFAGIVEQIGTSAAANAEGEHIAGIPYSAGVYAELGIAIARHVRSRRRAPAKVLALDGDGVLWGHVLGEEGFDGILLGKDGTGRHFQLFQQSILRLKTRECYSRSSAGTNCPTSDESLNHILA